MRRRPWVRSGGGLIRFAAPATTRRYPRFFDRFVWNDTSLAGIETGARTIAYLGAGLDTRPGISPSGKRPAVIRCNASELAGHVAMLRSLVRGRAPEAREGQDPRSLSALGRLARQLAAARYSAIVWDTADLDAKSADVVVADLCAMVRDLNGTTRSAGLALGGNDGGASFVNVAVWQAGFPLRIDHSTG